MKEKIIQKIFDYCHDINDLEVIINDSYSKNIEYRLGKKELYEINNSINVGIRAIKEQKQATISTNNLTDDALKDICNRLKFNLQNAQQDPYLELADKSLYYSNSNDLNLYDNYIEDDNHIINNLNKIENIAMSVDGIDNSEGIGYQSSKSETHIANKQGLNFSNKKSHYLYSVSLIAKSQENMEVNSDYIISRHYNDLNSITELAKNVADDTVKKLNPKSVKSGNMPVIFDKDNSSRLLSVFINAINGSAVSQGSSFLKDKLGELIFNDNINIYDDPLINKAIGSRYIDGDFMNSKANYLVKNGVLNNFLLDLRSANKLKLKHNNMSSRSYNSMTPYPSCSNCFIENGNISFTNMISNIKQGVYITQLFGMGVNQTTGNYSQGACGYMIINGEIAYPINNFTIAGNLIDMFKECVIADDLTFKNNVNSPSIRIDNMVIAGNN